MTTAEPTTGAVPESPVESPPDDEQVSPDARMKQVNAARLADMAVAAANALRDEGRVADGDVEFMSSGKIRVQLDDGVDLMLRRPKFGELKYLVSKQRAVTDVLERASQQARAAGQALIAKASELTDTLTGLTKAGSEEAMAAVRDEAAEAADRLADVTARELGGWWVAVFRNLYGDIDEDNLPGWCLDPSLPARAVEHWRTVPTVRG